MLKGPKDSEFNKIALKLIVHFNKFNWKICGWQFKINNFFSVLQFSLSCQILLLLDALLAHFWQKSQVCDSVDSTLPSNHFSLVFVHKNISIAEEWMLSYNWLAHLPDVTLRPSHMALESFPRTQLWDGTKDANALSWDGLIEHLEVEVV